jgi:hypothetical protein
LPRARQSIAINNTAQARIDRQARAGSRKPILKRSSFAAPIQEEIAQNVKSSKTIGLKPE